MTSFQSIVTRKGQITIPAEIRRSLGIEEGDHVQIVRVGETVQIRRALGVVASTAGVFREHARGMHQNIDELIKTETEAFETGIAEEEMKGLHR